MSRRSLWSLILLASPIMVSCRSTTSPPDPMGVKRERIKTLEGWLNRPVNTTEELLTRGHLAQLRRDLNVEEKGGLGTLPRFEGVPPTDIFPHAEFVSKSLVFELQTVRWFEDVWLMDPKDRSEEAGFTEATRRGYVDALAHVRQDPQGPFAFTSEHVALLRTLVDERAKALAAEKDPERYAFIEASVAWWKARLAEAGQ